MSSLFLACLCLSLAIPPASPDDPLQVVDGKESEEETKLPNSHSAAFVMAFIFLCLLAYGAYRVCRCHCPGARRPPLTVSLDGSAPVELGAQGLQDQIRQHEEYMAIFGPKGKAAPAKNLHVCEFKKDVDKPGG